MSKRIKRMKSFNKEHEFKIHRITFEENQVFIKKKWKRKHIIAVVIEQAKRNDLGKLVKKRLTKGKK